MNILVCGGAGYIGSHTVRRLIKEGYEVLVLDNLCNGHMSAIAGIPFVNADLCDQSALKQVFHDHKIDAVIHFAAYALVGESMGQPDIYYRNNVVGTLNLLESMLSTGVKHMVFSSTAAVYGDPLQLPISEDHRTVPTNAYGATKLAVEEMLRWFGQAFGLKYTSLRFFNAAGADPAGDIGEDHDPETHLIPVVIKAALGLIPHVKILGTDYLTRDGTCIRDYIHVLDLADAHVLALKMLLGEGRSAVYNLGSGEGYSVREVIKTAEEVTGRMVRTIEGDRRMGDPAVLVASAEKAERELGWKPECSRLETLIYTAWEWHRENPGGY